MKRLGRYTLLFERRPAILGHAAVCGKKEAAGPLAAYRTLVVVQRRQGLYSMPCAAAAGLVLA